MVGGWFGGGSSAAPAETASSDVMSSDSGSGYASSYSTPRVCENQVVQFKSCMDQNQGDLTICGWYMDQLKACQQAASQY